MPTLGILGVAHIHTPGFIERIGKRSEMRIKYVYDHDAARAQARATQVGAAYAADPVDVVSDPEVDAIVICSETARHLPLVEMTAVAGKPMFVEKPLAVSVADAERMAEIVRTAGVMFQTGFFMRGSAAAQFIYQEMTAGHLGTITRMRHTTCHQGALAGWFDKEWRWFTDAAEAGGGGFADLGAHSLDIILWTMCCNCGPVRHVAASIGAATGRYGAIDEYGVGLLTFDSGAIAVLEASWVDPKLKSPVEVTGTKGQIHVHDGKVHYYSELVEGADGTEWTALPPAKPHAFDLFLDALEGQDVELVGVDQAAEQSRVMAMLYQAAGRTMGH